MRNRLPLLCAIVMCSCRDSAAQVRCFCLASGCPEGQATKKGPRAMGRGRCSPLRDHRTRPDKLISVIHRDGGVVVHKASSLHQALASQRPAPTPLPSLAWKRAATPVPTSCRRCCWVHSPRRTLFHGCQIAAALALSADGVLMGSRFLTYDEISSHPNTRRTCSAVTITAPCGSCTPSAISGAFCATTQLTRSTPWTTCC